MMSATITRALSRGSAFWLQIGRLPAVYRFSSNDAGQKKDGASHPPAAKPPAFVGSVKAPPPPPQKAPPPPPPLQVQFDNSKYQVTQYFQYNPMSFYDFEVEISSTRLPQQSSLKNWLSSTGFLSVISTASVLKELDWWTNLCHLLRRIFVAYVLSAVWKNCIFLLCSYTVYWSRVLNYG